MSRKERATNLCGFFGSSTRPKEEVAGVPLQARGCIIKKVKTSLKGRKCKYLHCKHILSIYNHEDYCHIHLGLLASGDKVKAGKVS